MSDAAQAANTFISGSIENALKDFRVSFPCRVETFNKETCLATIQPLLKHDDNVPALIQNVPAIGQRFLLEGEDTPRAYKPCLHTGDIVFVVCSDQEVKNALSGALASPSSRRRHSLNDAVIIGVFPCSL
ncbi:hypothetical protein JNUCC42_13170 [Brevibacterium sp. JNUCC-42]|nr:hypothetical protein JNUCC42_13170 [Brevibacterium sp. JNUCC-42]